jgi:shikimate dehydrogenase
MISGKTKVFFMIADPIDHVRTPEVLNPLFAARGIDAVMVPIHFTPSTFATGWAAMRQMGNLGGIVVSVPLKEQALALSDQVEPAAAHVGAANVIRREADGKMVATNLDVAGFLNGVLNGGVDSRGRKALLLGAGGAGRAIAVALAEAGVSSLRIHDLDQTRAAELCAKISAQYPGVSATVDDPVLRDATLLINATPLGLHPETDPLPIDVADLHSGVLVADIVMKPRETPLLIAALAAGCDVRYGAGMLDTQLELMLRHFGY